MINFAATVDEKLLAFIDAVVTIRERQHPGHDYAAGYDAQRAEVWCETCGVCLKRIALAD